MIIKGYKNKNGKTTKNKPNKIILPVAFVLLSAFFAFMMVRSNSPSNPNNYIKYLYDRPKISLSTAELVPELSGQKILNNEFEELVQYFDSTNGTYSLYIWDSINNIDYSYNSSRPYYAASLYKVPLAVATLKKIEDGVLKMEDTLAFKNDDFSDGSGAINTSEIGTEYTVGELLEYLMKQSDNVAQNMLTKKMDQNSMRTAYSVEFSPDVLSDLYINNRTTAEDYSKYLTNLFHGDYLSPSSRSYLLDIMSETAFDDRISTHLSPTLKFSHKIGNWGETGSWHDCGVITGQGTYLTVCLMSDNITFDDFLSSGEETAAFINKLAGY